MTEIRFRDISAPILDKFPMVERPGWHVHFKSKFGWTIAILILYFSLGNVPLFGLCPESLDMFGRFRAIFAGEMFSMTALGIIPIVQASIVLQLLVGGGIINLNLSDPKDQAYYQNLQKLFVVAFAALISMTFVVGFYMPHPGIAAKLGVSLQFISALLFMQVFVGGMLIYFMDEVVTKWGIGSGVSLFILASVAQAIITGLISPIHVDGWAVGVIPRWIEIAQHVSVYEILAGGIIFLFENHMIALITTIAVFFIVVLLESTRMEIPLAHSQARGARGKFPIKLLYASVLPIILASALQITILAFGRLLYARGIDILGSFDLETGVALSGVMFYLDPIYSPWDWFPPFMDPHIAGWQIALKVAVNLAFMVIGGAVFALFWINTTGMGAKDVAAKIHRSGLQIPGHRRSPATIERMMEGYIPKIALMGGAIVGALSVLSNMFGTLGGATGIGLLLAVSIAYRLYETMAAEQMREMYPMMRRFFGGE